MLGPEDLRVTDTWRATRPDLRMGLLDEIQIHLIPVLLGGGIRLFEDLGPETIELRRTRSIETPNATHLRFEIVK